ncbi:thiolase family protein [Salipiger sp.]|uniref:thiolase family protein n=1 Tax=Salipiger sp. TaxID=2078585 RepID=UPI003A96FDED
MSGNITAAVCGVGTTDYGRLPGQSAYDLGLQALRAALDDAGLALSEVDGLIVNRIPSYQRFAELAGHDPDYVLTTPGQGRFSGICIDTAKALVESGRCRTVALVYGNSGRSDGMTYGGKDESAYGSEGRMWFPCGMTSPGAFHALMMQRHMHEFGTTPEQMAHVPITFRRHAALNPKAVMREEFDLDGYMNARPICDPLKLLDYCLINDGGAALIVTGADRAADLRKPPVHIRGSALRTAFAGSTFPPEDYWYAPLNEAATRGFAEAGLDRSDMDALMVYDNFTPTVLFSLEGCGYAPRGESGAWVSEGHLSLGGSLPANTSGGHLSESYLQGWALNIEAVLQIRGECGARQVAGARNVHYVAAAPVCSSIVYSGDAS